MRTTNKDIRLRHARGKEQLYTTTRTIKQSNRQANNQTDKHDENGWSSVVRGIGPVHQRKFPRHQPVCPGDPHSSRMHDNDNNNNVSVTKYRKQLLSGLLKKTDIVIAGATDNTTTKVTEPRRRRERHGPEVAEMVQEDTPDHTETCWPHNLGFGDQRGWWPTPTESSRIGVSTNESVFLIVLEEHQLLKWKTETRYFFSKIFRRL